MKRFRNTALLLVVGGLLIAGGINVNIPPTHAQGANGGPPYQSAMNLYSTNTPAKADPKTHFKTLLKAINYAGLSGAYKDKGPLTVFAPTDIAFGNLPSGELDSLIKDKAKLTQVLKYHVILGHAYKANELPGIKSATTAEGGTLTFQRQMTTPPNPMMIGVNGDPGPAGTQYITVNNTAEIVWQNIPVANGIVHGINQVLMPPQ